MIHSHLASLIQQQCIAQGWTLSLAESCTGGNLAAYLTRVPGCSAYFLGSIVAYSNALKTEVLGVKEETLATHGAVSGEVVGEMAEGVLKLTGSDYSLAVSGIAGPEGGTVLKPVGTIWVAMGKQGENVRVENFQLAGTRQEIIEKSIELLLAQFWLLIKN